MLLGVEWVMMQNFHRFEHSIFYCLPVLVYYLDPTALQILLYDAHRGCPNHHLIEIRLSPWGNYCPEIKIKKLTINLYRLMLVRFFDLNILRAIFNFAINTSMYGFILFIPWSVIG